jgi:hypothetical protein
LKRMDCRVKPGNDGLRITAPDVTPPLADGRAIVSTLDRVTRGLDHASRIYPTCAPKTPEIG